MIEQKEITPIKHEDNDKYTRIYYIQDIRNALKFNKYDIPTLRLIDFLLRKNKNKAYSDPIRITYCSEETLFQKAAVLGYTVRCDQQEIIGDEKLFADRECTIKLEGYDLLKNGVPIDGIYRVGEVAPRMSLSDLEHELRKLYQEQGLEW